MIKLSVIIKLYLSNYMKIKKINSLTSQHELLNHEKSLKIKDF